MGTHPSSITCKERRSGGRPARIGLAACRSCHGADDRGTELSRAFTDRTFASDFGLHRFWRGFQISCFSCHDGPDSEQPSANHPAQVANAQAEVESMAADAAVEEGRSLAPADADADVDVADAAGAAGADHPVANSTADLAPDSADGPSATADEGTDEAPPA